MSESPGAATRRAIVAGRSAKAQVAGDKAIKDGIGEEREREIEPPLAAPARAPRRGDGADLRGDEAQAAGVEILAQRRGDGAIAVPAQLDDARLEAGKPQACRKARGRATRMEDEIGLALGILRSREIAAQGGSDARRARD